MEKSNRNDRIKYYEFECGCRVEKVERKDRVINGKRVYKKMCSEHLKPLKHMCVVCGDCGEDFFSKTKSQLFCIECGKERRKKRTRMANRRLYARRKEEALNSTCTTAKIKKNKKVPKIKVDQEKRADCKHGAYCVNRECYFGEKFNCHNCRRFEQRDFEFDVDLKSKENMEFTNDVNKY